MRIDPDMNYEDIEETFLRNLSFKVSRNLEGRNFSITPEFDSKSIKAELEAD